MFKFRLQRVLEMRERHERDAATALAAAQDAAAAAQRAADVLAAARAELAAGALGGTATTRGAGPGAAVGALRTHAFLLDRMDEQVAAAGAAARAAEGVVGAREDGLRAAFRDRRTLDRLRERHEGAWRALAVAADRQQMDEIALVRFAQSMAAPGAASAPAAG
jgi:flagellar FliJ protein